MRHEPMLNAARLFAAAALVVAIVTASAPGQGFERKQIVPTTGNAVMQYGLSMQRDGDVLVVGAPFDDTKGVTAGTVYVYRHDPAADAWNLEQQLFPNDPEASSFFGSSVAVSGDVLVVGAPLKDDATGADAGVVYVFRHDATSQLWSEEEKLLASNGSDEDELGTSVSIDGDVLIAGAPGSDASGVKFGGAAYVYRYQDSTIKWAEEACLVDAYPSFWGERMGTSVVVDGDRAFAGAPDYDSVGVVLTYTRSAGAWTQGATVTGYASSVWLFGSSIAVSGDVLAVGAPQSDLGSWFSWGVVFVFRWDGFAWEQEWAVEPPVDDGEHAKYFGGAVAIDGDTLAIGAPLDDAFGISYSGSAWIARHGRKGWVLDQQFAASDAESDDRLGTAVLLTDQALVASAPGKNMASGTKWGGLYLYPRPIMNLDISPSSPLPSSNVTFTALYGNPLDAALISLEDLDGTPTFVPILLSTFGSDHTMGLSGTTPPLLYGITIGFRAYRVGPFDHVVRSDLEYLNL